MRPTEKLFTLDFAARQVRQMHGSVTDEDHQDNADACDCEYGACLRGLSQLLAETKNFRAALERQRRGKQPSPLAAR
jgi:hypothetical protein